MPHSTHWKLVKPEVTLCRATLKDTSMHAKLVDRWAEGSELNKAVYLLPSGRYFLCDDWGNDWDAIAYQVTDVNAKPRTIEDMAGDLDVLREALAKVMGDLQTRPVMSSRLNAIRDLNPLVGTIERLAAELHALAEAKTPTPGPAPEPQPDDRLWTLPDHDYSLGEED